MLHKPKNSYLIKYEFWCNLKVLLEQVTRSDTPKIIVFKRQTDFVGIQLLREKTLFFLCKYFIDTRKYKND